MQSSTRRQEAEADVLSREQALSAFMDGEGADAWPLDLDTPKGRQDWDTYHLIGDVLRSPGLSIQVSEKWRVRLAGALEAEPTLMAPRRGGRAWRFGLSGLAAAAAVASVAWVAQPYFSTGTSPAPVLADGRNTEAPALLEYVDAHRELANPGSGIRQVSFDGGL